jgi:hypothetical protein
MIGRFPREGATQPQRLKRNPDSVESPQDFVSVEDAKSFENQLPFVSVC